MKSFKENKLRDEFISKISDIFNNLSGGNSKTRPDIKTLWRWIKTLIKREGYNNQNTVTLTNNSRRYNNNDTVVYILIFTNYY
jgi:hypothetical protein